MADNGGKLYRPGSSLQLASGRESLCRRQGLRGNILLRSFLKIAFPSFIVGGLEGAAAKEQGCVNTSCRNNRDWCWLGPQPQSSARIYQVYVKLKAEQKCISKRQVVNEELGAADGFS